MRSSSLFLSVLALTVATLAAPIPERPDLKMEAAYIAPVNHRGVPVASTLVKNPTSVVVRTAPAVNVIIENPNDVVT